MFGKLGSVLIPLVIIPVSNKIYLINTKNEKANARYDDEASKDYVVGGSTVNAMDEAPWQVIVQARRIRPDSAVDEKPSGYMTCGGSLVSRRHVITAAHCLYDWNYPPVYHPPPEDLYVFMGKLNIEDKTGTLVKVRKVFMHPEYDYFYYTNDIAVLELTKDVYFDKQPVKPLCLPTQPVAAASRETATISGFGTTSIYTPLSSPAELQILRGLKIYDKCPEIPHQYLTIREGMFCAGGEEGKDSCSGDSGGPIWIPAASGCKTATLIGVTSWGNSCGLKDVPGVYTDVFNMLQQDNLWLCNSLALPREQCPASPINT